MAATTVYTAVCWGGLTGSALSLAYYYDVNDNIVFYPKFSGTSPPTGTKLVVKTASAGFAAGTVMYAGYDVGGGYVSFYWDAALTSIVTPTAYGTGYIYLRNFDTDAFLIANSARYDTRVYNGLNTANTARAALPDASRTDVIEILDAFYDAIISYIGIVNYATEVTTKVNNVRTPAFHNGTLSGYSIRGVLGQNSNITLDGVIANSTTATANSAIDMTSLSNAYYNVFVKNCITVDTNNSAAYNIGGINLPIGGNAENCICITKRTQASTVGVVNTFANGSANIKNCVAVGFATGFSSKGATVQNCVAVDAKVPFYNTGNSKPRRDSNNAVALKDCLVFTPVIGSANNTYTRPANLDTVTYYGVSLYTTGTFPTVSAGAALSTSEMYNVQVTTSYINIVRASNNSSVTMTSLGTGTHYIVFATKSTDVAPIVIPDYDTVPTNTFVDPANFNFRLAAMSLLIDAATSESIYAPTDMLGAERPSYNNGGAEYIDIGALEYDKGYGPHPASTTVTFDGVNAGSEIRVYNNIGTEIAGVENCDVDHVLSWSLSVGDVRIVIVNFLYVIQDFTYTPAAGAQSIPVQQRVDRWAYDPA